MEVDKIIGLIDDVVVLKLSIHIERSAQFLPGVTGDMFVKVDVSVYNLIKKS